MNKPFKSYLLTKVLTASTPEVIVYLYESAITNLQKAYFAVIQKKFDVAGSSLDQVVKILIELAQTLDRRVGAPLVFKLDALYNYLLNVLLNSETRRDIDTLQNCESVMTVLLDAWRQVAIQDQQSKLTQPEKQIHISA